MDYKIYIITVCFNSEKYIKETLNSVLNQKYTHIKHIIIDGGSTDNTLKFIDHYMKKGQNITLISEKDSDIYDAMNKGISLVKDNNAYLLFLNSDDILYSNESIEELVKDLKPDIEILVSRMLLFDERNEYIVGAEYNYKDLIFKNINHPSTLIKRSLFEDIGNYDTNYMISADHDFFIKAFKSNKAVRFSDKITTKMRIGGISSKKLITSKYENLKIIISNYDLYSIIKYLIYISLYIIFIYPLRTLVKNTIILEKFVNSRK